MSSSPSQPGFDTRTHVAIACGVFVLALVVRLMFLLSSADRNWPHSVAYEGDAVIWARTAEMFARGQVPDDGVPHRFYAIAHLIHWFGTGLPETSFLPFKIAWCTLSALACGIAYLVFVRNLPARPAAIATALCVFSFGSYVLATSLNVEGLYAPLLILILGGTLEMIRRPAWWLVVALSILNALALLTREEHLVLLLGLSGYAWWRWWRVADSATEPPPRGARRIAPPAIVVLGAVCLCLPYSVHATRATTRYNSVPKQAPDYAVAGVPWSPDARQFVDSLPAFVRAKTADLVGQQARKRGVAMVTPDLARQVLVEFFGYIPDPLATPVFIASHGPMSFALSNHPESDGGFSRAALETQFGRRQSDPRLNLTTPEHLRIFNHGYAVGLGYIKADVRAWLGNLVTKLGHAYQGATLGFTAYNLPYGRFGQRRAVDLLTPFPGVGVIWQVMFGLLLVVGGRLAWRRSDGRLWLLVIAYKTAIVLAYYGYSRQMTSILPAFFVIAALGMDHTIALLGRHLPAIAPSARAKLGAIVVAAVIGLEIHAATHSPRYEIVGPVRPLPQWGPEAFGANAPIEIRSSS